jgi:glycosyltransferase involved in cell wall biosynthesis
MKVALIGRYRVPFPFSAHRLDYVMLKRLAAEMNELRCELEWREKNLIVHYAPAVNFGGAVPAFVAWALRRVARINRAASLDIVNGSDLWGGLTGILVRRVLPVKVLAQLQDEFLRPIPLVWSRSRRWVLAGMARFVCRRGDIVRCLYESARRQVVALGVPQERVYVVPSRCDVDLFDPTTFPPRTFTGVRLLYVGNLVRRKGVDYLLRAFREVLHEYPEATLTIVGSGSDEEALRKVAGDSELAPRVVFAGRRRHEELPAILRAADLFVFPSLSEATPRAVLEAMAMELSVVATNVGGIPEMVVDGVSGLLVPPADSALLARAVCQGLSDPEWREAAGQRGRQRVLTTYTLDHHVSRMLTLHRTLLRGQAVVGIAAGAP